MISLLQRIFEEKYIVDNRDPLFTFSLPFVTEEKTFGLFAPTVGPWIQLSLFLVIQLIIQSIYAALIYRFIVQRRRTTEAYLLGWAFIPTACFVPFYLLDILDIQNRVISLGASTVATCVVFRCIEAIYNTSPEVVESSLQNYIAYYSSPVPFIWDNKTKAIQKASTSRLLSFLMEIKFYFISASLVLSFLLYHDFRPFGPSMSFDNFELTWELLNPVHIGNAYFHVLMIYLTLSTGFNLTALNEMLKGRDCHKIFDSPLLLAQTPTEFWTERWNLMTQRLLKTGVFLPLRQYFSSKASLLLTFLASGLYHDYVWACIFYSPKNWYDENGTCDKCYEHKFGRVTCFFVCTALIMLLERPLGKLAPFQWMSKNLPRCVIAHLLLLVHLPFSLWYYGDWIAGGYFNHFSILLWLIRPV